MYRKVQGGYCDIYRRWGCWGIFGLVRGIVCDIYFCLEIGDEGSKVIFAVLTLGLNIVIHLNTQELV